MGVEVPYPGVDFEANPMEFRYHRYYQWVSFVLFFQSTLFYIPRWLWKMWEGGKIQALMMDLDVGVCSEQEKRQKKKLLVDYLYSSRGHHNWYAARYFFCEILALVNVVFQMFALDKFFDGEFLTYGLQVIEFSQLDQGKLVRLPQCLLNVLGGRKWEQGMCLRIEVWGWRTKHANYMDALSKTHSCLTLISTCLRLWLFSVGWTDVQFVYKFCQQKWLELEGVQGNKVKHREQKIYSTNRFYCRIDNASLRASQSNNADCQPVNIVRHWLIKGAV